MAVEKFLAAHLKGRYQEGGSPEVEARLSEITVDPKTVVLSNLLDPSTVGVPEIASDLKPGVYRFDAKLSMGDEEMPLKISVTVTDTGVVWSIRNDVDSPMGPMHETVTLDRHNLTLQRRTVLQGPLSIDLDFSSGKALGTMNMNGQERAISADLGGPLFADAVEANLVIGCLPLADGYGTAFRNFDVQKQKVKLMQLQVAGSERVTVPAGTFDTFQVELSSAEGGPDKSTVWIAKETRTPVKMSTLMAEMGGATLTAELLP
jgi:hypothetical protein